MPLLPMKRGSPPPNHIKNKNKGRLKTRLRECRVFRRPFDI
ncbi:hypothetical protein NEIELOOT_03039 [Neisseria elongata subsp. glycolytica ATCC 29315]|uniref:Uncharacterized protein n=1 Tax=Neisseria elongata subsp. glycolytica ATCC 29315 TaxID=546263 RepID=D4DVC2_NEIEG|nr:hypothetical protein NEIELOOT_03039 [Neisseria elongata subsp. glycolytica ATCC 29315]